MFSRRWNMYRTARHGSEWVRVIRPVRDAVGKVTELEIELPSGERFECPVDELDCLMF